MLGQLDRKAWKVGSLSDSTVPREAGQRTDTLRAGLSTDRTTNQRNPIKNEHGIQPKKYGTIRSFASVKSFQLCDCTESKIRPDDTVFFTDFFLEICQRSAP